MANNKKDEILKPFGFSEMYEWAKIPSQKLGLFVQFNKRNPELIELSHDSDAEICGVTTICSVIESDNPTEWHDKYMTNEVGDVYLVPERLAVGIKQYDSKLEMSYIGTYPYDHYIRIQNEKYNEKLKYELRTERNEWIRVNILGKCIVRDNGECKPGEYCMPYVGKELSMYGQAMPYDGKSNRKFYVLRRISKNTILIKYC